MALASCPRCKRLFEKIKSNVCVPCQSDEDADLEKVRQFVSINPDQSIDVVAQNTRVSKECVKRLLADGRIGATPTPGGVKCGMCGAPAISLSKRLCESCLAKLNQRLLEQQKKVILPERKGVKIGEHSIFEMGEDGQPKDGHL